jgi:hypothetical protein
MTPRNRWLDDGHATIEGVIASFLARVDEKSKIDDRY